MSRRLFSVAASVVLSTFFTGVAYAVTVSAPASVSVTAPPQQVAFCLSSLPQGSNTSGLTQTTVNGTQMYCGSNPVPGAIVNPVATGDTQTPISATDCSGITGARPATASDIPLMQLAGIPNATVGECWVPSDANVGQGEAQAKQDLGNDWCGGKAAQCTDRQGVTYTSTIDGLDPKFAVCADKFMQALKQQDPSACLRSAFRSTQHQVCACGGNANGIPGKCAPAGSSYHQKGLAIDVTYRISNQQAWNIAATAGIGNPTGLHSSDPSHFQPLGNSSGLTNCAAAGYVPPNATGDMYITPTTQTPTFAFTNALRGLLASTLLAPTVAPPIATTAPAPITSSPTYTNPIQYYPPTSTSTAQNSLTSYTTSNLGQQNQVSSLSNSPSGISSPGSISVTGPNGTQSSTQGSAGATANNQTTGAGANSGSSPTSQQDISLQTLLNLAGEQSSGSNTSAQSQQNTPAQLNTNVQGQTSTLQGNPAPSGSGSTFSSNGTQSSFQAPQTFTSSNLGGTIPPATGVSSQSTIQATFTQIESMLGTMLTYLRPFGGRVPATNPSLVAPE